MICKTVAYGAPYPSFIQTHASAYTMDIVVNYLFACTLGVSPLFPLLFFATAWNRRAPRYLTAFNDAKMRLEARGDSNLKFGRRKSIVKWSYLVLIPLCWYIILWYFRRLGLLSLCSTLRSGKNIGTDKYSGTEVRQRKVSGPIFRVPYNDSNKYDHLISVFNI